MPRVFTEQNPTAKMIAAMDAMQKLTHAHTVHILQQDTELDRLRLAVTSLTEQVSLLNSLVIREIPSRLN